MNRLPVWLKDEYAEDVVKLLRNLIKHYDLNGSILEKRITKNVLPSLYQYINFNKRTYVVDLLDELESMSIIKILKNNEDIKKISIVLNAIPVLRNWLDMPEISDDSLRWQEAIELSLPDDIVHLKECLKNADYPGIYDPERILLAISRLNNYLEDASLSKVCLTWRQVSANFFFGDSKYLDLISRKNFLGGIFPLLDKNIMERPIQLSVFLGCFAYDVLLVENWDSFLFLKNQKIGEKFYLIYAAGFKASAKYVRQYSGVKIFYSGDLSKKDEFESIWFLINQGKRNIYFWGDLDYSGLDILGKLEVPFPNIEAWKPGYEPMVNAILMGTGHKPYEAGKDNQQKPTSITCEYAQKVLLPALDSTGLMLDQEWLTVFELEAT